MQNPGIGWRTNGLEIKRLCENCLNGHSAFILGVIATALSQFRTVGRRVGRGVWTACGQSPAESDGLAGLSQVNVS